PPTSRLQSLRLCTPDSVATAPRRPSPHPHGPDHSRPAPLSPGPVQEPRLRSFDSSDNGSYVYDALYVCDRETGTLRYIRWCGGGGRCQSGIVPNDNCIKI